MIKDRLTKDRLILEDLFSSMDCEMRLSECISDCVNDKKNAVFVYADVDDFKNLQFDTARDTLKRCVEDSAALLGEKSYCYLFAGDEAAILLTGADFYAAKNIYGKIKEIFLEKGGMTLSCGAVIIDSTNADITPAEIIYKAKCAMYLAKSKGKNTIVLSKDNKNAGNIEETIDDNMFSQVQSTEDFSEFEIFYQPIMKKTQDGYVCSSAEALLRWNSDEYGFLSPMDFIPMAENVGFIKPLGRYVLFEACRQCAKWNEYNPGFKVNVNLSMLQFYDNDIVEQVKKAVNDSGIRPECLVLEITESATNGDLSEVRRIIKKLRKFGCRVALDDFGCGNSSLEMVRDLPLDYIKIDRSFAADISINEYSKQIVRTVVELSRRFDAEIVMEGIEDKDSLATIDGFNIKMVQGFYFDKPLMINEFETRYILNV